MMINPFTYYGAEKGPRILFLGGVHGDEPCGTRAIERFIYDLDQGHTHIRAGQVTFIPDCNARARAEELHYIDTNLNRLFGREKPGAHENGIARQIEPYIRDHDILIDLHSYQSGPDFGQPFIFMDQNQDELHDLIGALNVPIVITRYQKGNLTPGTTVHYARKLGKLALTAECGDDKDPASADIGYHIIYNALEHLNMLGITKKNIQVAGDQEWYVLDNVYYKKKQGHFTRDWQHLEPLPTGTVVAVYDDGEELRIDQDVIMIMPTAQRNVGDEWFWTGSPI